MTTVLVIGASRGIGLELVRQYCEAGARVIATARDEAGLQRLRELGAIALTLDVADPSSVSGLTGHLDGEKIDIAWYVAGVIDRASATTSPSQLDFDRVMRTNVLGAMQTIPQVAPLVEAAGGTFAFISSAMGQIGRVESSYSWVYRVSKAALNMAVAAAQSDYPRATLLAISPGWVKTDMGGEAASLTVQASVAAMRKAIAAPQADYQGAFLDRDGRPFDTW